MNAEPGGAQPRRAGEFGQIDDRRAFDHRRAEALRAGACRPSWCRRWRSGRRSAARGRPAARHRCGSPPWLSRTPARRSLHRGEGQLALLADRHEADVELVGQHRADDEAARVEPGDRAQAQLEKRCTNWSISTRNTRGLDSSGVMSRNWMPGEGQSARCGCGCGCSRRRSSSRALSFNRGRATSRPAPATPGSPESTSVSPAPSTMASSGCVTAPEGAPHRQCRDADRVQRLVGQGLADAGRRGGQRDAEQAGRLRSSAVSSSAPWK